MPGVSTLTIAVDPPFHLPAAVCSYGYFLLAPNAWEPGRRDGGGAAWRTVVRDEADQPVRCRVTQPGGCDAPRLRIACDRRLSRGGAAAVKRQIARVLRLDEDFSPWRRLHPRARRARFDRTFRSATLFEDIVKTMTGCNVTWPNTMRMNRLLCEHIGPGDAFPTPAELARVRPATLKAKCKVGYRAQRIVQLARDVESGRLDLAWFEHRSRSSDELHAALLRIHGVGPYAAANLCQLLGHYDRLAIDTETYRHFRQVHNEPTPKTPAELRRLHDRVHAHYDRYAPYSFLAYWFELWGDYQKRAGKATQWTAEKTGATFTAANLR